MRALKDIVNIYELDEDGLQQVFGDYVEIAIELLNERDTAVEEGFMQDWTQFYGEWAHVKLTENQLFFLEGYRSQAASHNYTVQFHKLSKKDASCLIEILKTWDAIPRRLERNRKRQERDREKMFKNSLSSDATVRRWYMKLVTIWNKIMEDERVDVEELRVMKKWLYDHRRNEDEFASLIACIDRVKEDGVVTPEEAMELYNEICAAVDKLF